MAADADRRQDQLQYTLVIYVLEVPLCEASRLIQVVEHHSHDPSVHFLGSNHLQIGQALTQYGICKHHSIDVRA